MNLNVKTVGRLWAALMNDFETVTRRYLTQPRWDFAFFCKLARQQRLSLVMNLAIGVGKHRDQNYKNFCRLIFDAAKLFWVQARSTFDGGDMERKLDVKRRLGGFYLVYLLYMKQPHQGLEEILLDQAEVGFFDEFVQNVQLFLPNKLEVQFMIEILKANKAFVFSPSSNEHGIEVWRRALLTVSQTKIVQLSLMERNIQDQLSYVWNGYKFHRNSTENRDREKEAFFLDQLLRKTETMFSNGSDALVSFDNSDNSIYNADNYMEKIANRPVLTMSHLSGDPLLERRLIFEYRQLLDVAHKRVLENPRNEYMLAGSLWDRKSKKRGDENQPKRRRERGHFSKNLTVYLNDLPFSSEPVNTVNTEPANEEVLESEN